MCVCVHVCVFVIVIGTALRRPAATVIAFVAVSVMYEVNQWDQNFYMKLGVPRNSPRSMYHKAYKE
jgi:hypothetical protein